MDGTARWQLDNVGKFYSAQARSNNQTVFRISATMADPIDPEKLQLALDDAIKSHPGFNVTLESGFYWRRLREGVWRPLVRPEGDADAICGKLHFGPESVLFRVSWHECAINLEVSHMISDGRGALELMKSLLGFYVKWNYGEKDAGDASTQSEETQTEDSYSRNYEPAMSRSTKTPKAYRLPGWRNLAKTSFTELRLDAEAVHARAKSIGVSVTSLVIASIMCAIAAGMHPWDRRRTVLLDIPVDLRRFYDSATLRNFFGLAFVAYAPDDVGGDVDDVARDVQRQLSEATQLDVLKRRMNRMVKLEKNPFLRRAPVFLKDIALRIADRISSRQVTATASSLGRIELPDAIARHVRSMTVLTSTRSMSFTFLTFGDELSIGISSILIGQDVQDALVDRLAQMGFAVARSTL